VKIYRRLTALRMADVCAGKGTFERVNQESGHTRECHLKMQTSTQCCDHEPSQSMGSRPPATCSSESTASAPSMQPKYARPSARKAIARIEQSRAKLSLGKEFPGRHSPKQPHHNTHRERERARERGGAGGRRDRRACCPSEAHVAGRPLVVPA
jgi:hypothetical protein